MMAARSRHVPLRSCVVCGNKTSKDAMVRIVSTPPNKVSIDETGRLSGRGAYVCRQGACGPEGLRRGRVEHALRTTLSDGEWTGIASFWEASSAAR